MRTLLKYTDDLVKDPTMLVSTNMKDRKKKGEEKAGYRRGNLNIALNLHAALRMGLMTTKRPLGNLGHPAQRNQPTSCRGPSQQDLPCW
jgi:hypothetical protein